MKLPPELVTSRLRLVAPAKRHLDGLFAYGSRLDFTAFLDSKAFRTMEQAEHFLRSLQTDNRLGRRMYWVAELRNEGRAVGTLGLLFPFAAHHRVAEFGYGFSPDVWGSGLFAEAAQAVLNYGFVTLGLHRIQALTRSANMRAVKAVEKIGFHREAVLAEFYQEQNGRRGSAALLVKFAPKAAKARARAGDKASKRNKPKQ